MGRPPQEQCALDGAAAAAADGKCVEWEYMVYDTMDGIVYNIDGAAL